MKVHEDSTSTWYMASLKQLARLRVVTDAGGQHVALFHPVCRRIQKSLSLLRIPEHQQGATSGTSLMAVVSVVGCMAQRLMLCLGSIILVNPISLFEDTGQIAVSAEDGLI
ncbi:hypothetical protein P7K49_038384 [Saguinus oedipus]|uniref:Uncharacterized protein n=1 Tax=Saguinus oedipus TaxID=9490 RepID=A0ABQ9TEI9_SAGOE|nr:hypothetical protein P7K49_038384 [Saguinus oedipus]